MQQFKEISFWAKNLGHLPVHLEPTVNDKYIMLNGISGNFCLHISDTEEDENTYFSQSWSSNTKNFLLLNNINAKLFNWYTDNKVEKISLKSIQENLDKFYKYIVAKSHRSDKDVIPVIIDIFKQFRTLTAEYHNPVQALNLLFVLLAGLQDGDINAIDRQKWSISDIHIPQGFDAFIERFNLNTRGISPDLNLILRHSAGALFQEAQKEVIFFDNQMDLFGTFSGSIATKNLIYSSIHYTPSYLARSIVENTLRTLNLNELNEIKILDPACGSAEFLIEVLKQLKEKNFKGAVKVQGYDSSETAINTSSFLLNFEKRTVWGDKLTYDVKKVNDSLVEDWGNYYTIILMNPPFVSWEQLNDKAKRDAVRSTLNDNFKGRPNQASAFFYKAIQHLAVDGTLGSVVPSSLFTLDAYLKLRNEVSETINIELLGKLGNFVFEDALTDVSVFIGHKPKTANSVPTLLWTRNEKGVVHDALRELRKMQYANEDSKNKIDFSIFKPNHFPVIEDSWKAVSFKEYNLIRDLKLFVIAEKLTNIGNLFNVQQGVRPGNKKVFVISEEEFLKLPVNERKFFLASIDNETLNNGTINIKNYLWYPYNKKNGQSLINSEEELIKEIPEFYRNYLQPYIFELKNRKKEVPNWWSLSDRAPRLLPLSTCIISTEFGNSSSFAIDVKGNYIVERGYAWQPKQKLENNDFYFYLSLFSSPFFDKLLSIYSKQLAGGKWYDLGKMYTKEIPIPNVHLSEVRNSSAYGKMIELGKRLSEGDSYVKAVLDDVVSVYYPKDLI
jgi:adenine-specific DNA-methyltransferase